MSKLSTGSISCPKCKHQQSVEVYTSINTKLDPGLRERFLNQDINIFSCEKCGLEMPIATDVMYHDMERGFIVYIVPNGDFEAKKAELASFPSFGGIADYFKNPLFVKSYPEALIMVHLCESNGAPKSEEERANYYQAYKEMSAVYEKPTDIWQDVSPEPFDLLDAYNEKGYDWATEALQTCGPITGLRTDLISYALAMIVDDFIHYVMGYVKQEWEDVLDEEFGNHEDVWEQIFTIRAEIFRLLKEKIGIEGIVASLEQMTEVNDTEEQGVTFITLSDERRLKVRDFVSNGLGY